MNRPAWSADRAQQLLQHASPGSIIIVLQERRLQLERLETSAVGAGELSRVWRVDAHAGMPKDAVE